jgi:ADP-heptose:LPS heptosyltransferase
LAILHIGCVSFLMHSANGVDVPSVIIYGGRET